jgi:UDP-N-acetylmuramyl pentapeptide phosphotransferase/UDP-N-acetylglucosamine-1-phosphate transferase
MLTNLLIVFILIILANYFFKKKNIIPSTTGSIHQNFVNKSVPLTGGIFILFLFIFLLLNNSFEALIFYILIFFLGILSDLDILRSPRKRFLIQTFIVIFFVIYLKLEALPTRIEIIDNKFDNTLLSFLFTGFCLMVLMNGSNFIDGLNGLALGYFILILFFLYKLGLYQIIDLENQKILICIYILSFILILNFLNKLFLGDNGAYSLSFIIGFILIDIYQNSINISPYYIILLLWYPCFENLFSIMRKLVNKKNPLNPDTNHIHQFVFIFFKEKIKLNSLLSNNLASLLINSFNFIILYAGSQNINHTLLQLKLLALSIAIYILVYYFLKNLIRKEKLEHSF